MPMDRDQMESLLSAVDAAFGEGLHGHYGGGIVVVTADGDGALDQAIARQGAHEGRDDLLVLGLGLRDNPAPPGNGLLGAGQPTVPLGAVAFRPGAPPGTSHTAAAHTSLDIHVETELFDDLVGNGACDAGALPTGLLVRPSSSGPTLTVVRTTTALAAAQLDLGQQRRGWLPPQGRGQVNRGGGLGSNGYRRANVPALPYPAAQALLGCLGARLARADGLGPALKRVVVGFRIAVS